MLEKNLNAAAGRLIEVVVDFNVGSFPSARSSSLSRAIPEAAEPAAELAPERRALLAKYVSVSWPRVFDRIIAAVDMGLVAGHCAQHSARWPYA